MQPKQVTHACVIAVVLVGQLQAQDAHQNDSLSHAETSHHKHPTQAGDSGFAALQQRGGQIMGVDQYRSAHRFDALPDGGRIELQSLTGDSVDVAQIRRHFTEILAAFRAGDFSQPLAVHAGVVPGTTLMRERRDRIRYTRRDLSSGAELRLTTADEELVQAIHDFIAFQRRDHRAPGNEP